MGFEPPRVPQPAAPKNRKPIRAKQFLRSQLKDFCRDVLFCGDCYFAKQVLANREITDAAAFDNFEIPLN